MDDVPSSRRPPGSPRRVRRSNHPTPSPADRLDTTPLDVPRTEPSPWQPPAGDDPPTTVLPAPSAPDGGPRVTVTRVAVARSRHLTSSAARRVREAGRADGAAESGLTQLL